MASAIFYNAAKKENSTLRPSGGTTIDVKLKDGTNLISPVFILNHGSTPTWTEVFFEGRYYFVNSIESVRNDLWAISCRVDALATYKDAIGAQTLYVVRSSARFDGAIIDTEYPAKAGITVEETETPSFYDAFNFFGGTYVVGIISAGTGGSIGVGAVKYYAMQLPTFIQFMQKLMGDISEYGVDGTEVSANLQKMLFNPFQYIASCVWFPFSIDKFAQETIRSGSIPYGWWNLTGMQYVGKMTTAAPVTINRTLATLSHPQQQTRGAYLSGAPYTRKFVRCMPFGMVEIDPQIFFGAANVGLFLSVDSVTGAGILQIYKPDEDWKDIQTVQAQIGVPIQLAQMNLNYEAQLQARQSKLDAVGGVITGLINPVGMTKRINAAIGDAILSTVPTLQTNNMNGGAAALQGTISCIHQFQTIVDEDNAHRGRPYCQLAQIGSVGGFMVVSDADFDIACTDTERAIIKQFLESGFYYE